jgi:hypothetical protein
MTTIYGPILDATVVEDAFVTALRTWARDYTAEVERQRGIAAGTAPQPLEWRILNRADAPIGPLTPPIVLIESSGIEGRPDRIEGGQYTATWRVEMTVIAGNSDDVSTRRLARRYIAALRAAVLQQPPAGCTFIEWAGEDYNRGPAERERTEAHGWAAFNVYMPDVVTTELGPAEPTAPSDPVPPTSPQAPVVDDIDITATPVADLS